MEVDHQKLKDVIGAYVLGALPPEEASSFRSHVATCDECSADAAHLSRAVEELSLTVEPADPPAGFSQRVMDRVARERPGTTTTRARTRPWNRLALLSTAAAVALAVVLGVIALDARQTADANRRVAAALLESADGVSLSGRPGVLAKVLTTGSGTVFVATGMEDPPSDRTYQLWLFEEGSPVSAGTFDPSEGVAIVRTSRSSESIEGAAVTVEPRGGSRSPTTQPVMQSG